MYIHIEGLSVFPSYFIKYIEKDLDYLRDTEYDPSADFKTSFHIGADIFNSLFLYDFFIFFHV